jgi:hypothetical protein
MVDCRNVLGQRQRLFERYSWSETSSWLWHARASSIWHVGIILLRHVKCLPIIRLLRTFASPLLKEMLTIMFRGLKCTSGAKLL